ncbi:MAG: hypothetical protein EP344_01770 [Bacteroidetes bacterium]|nr:MAG: hypothetical protein EP344_01770 [Bacteroidota bacterium]
MKTKHTGYLLTVCLLGIMSCQLTTSSPSANWTVESESFFKRYCIDNQQCAEVNLIMPLYKGEHSATLGAFNDKIRRHLGTLANAPADQPIEIGFDTVTTKFFDMFNSFKAQNPNTVENWKLELRSSVPVLNSKITTVEAVSMYNMWDKRELTSTHLISYDFRKEKYLTTADLVSDTIAFRPILEAAFCRAQNLTSPAEIRNVLSPNFQRLPLPRYIAVMPNGIRVVYNYSEISHLLIPLTDFTLSWEEMKGLSERNDWLD